MNSTAPLSGSHLRTYNTIFQHPISHNLGWRDVHSLFRNLGEVVEEPNGNLKVTRNGQVLVLHHPTTKDVAEADEVMNLRRFLERSETELPATNSRDTLWLLVIDRHAAHIFRSEIKGGVPQTVLAHEAGPHFRQAHHSKDFTRGQDRPDPSGFFGPVAKVLKAGGPILIFGNGTGMGSEMDQFAAWLKNHNPEIATRVVGTLVVDEHHLTDGQLLAKAREFYTTSGRS
jgi:hypothetical protein